MTQVVLIKNRQTFDHSSVQVGSEAKNPLPMNSEKYANDLAGLTWLLLEDPIEFDK